MKIFSLALLLCISQPAFASTKIIPAEAIFDSPIYFDASVSPDGKHFSILEFRDKYKILMIVDIDSEEQYEAAQFHREEYIQEYFWLNESQIYLKVERKSGRVEEMIYDFEFGVERDIKKFRKLKEGYLVDGYGADPSQVLFAHRTGESRRIQRIYKVAIDDLKMGDLTKATLLEEGDEDTGIYFYDEQFERLIVSTFDWDSDSVIIKWRGLEEQEWHVLLEYKNEEYVLAPVGFMNATTMAVLSNKDTDKIALFEFDTTTQTLGKLLFEHDKYDLVGANVGADGQLSSAHFYQHGIYTKHYFDNAEREFADTLLSKFDGRMAFITETDSSGNVIVVYAEGSDHPGSYHVYNLQTKQSKKLFDLHPNLEEYQFVKSTPIAFTSDDGTELEAFLTVPEAHDRSTLLVMPHGGPIGIQETDLFNQSVQFYVNRGFTVLRVNFRGSAGYGKEFQESGVGEFGKLIEQDISAAVELVRAQREYQHMCSIGASYGGYSSVMLAIAEPEIYDCVIASFGIYDLPLLYNHSNYRTGDEYIEQVERTVGQFDESLKAQSPVYMAEQLQQPILLIAGMDDEISGIEQSNRFKYALERAGKNIESLFYKHAGHGHDYWHGDQQEGVYTIDFLSRTLGLEYPHLENLSEHDAESLANGFVTAADYSSFDVWLPQDKETALRFYQLAADYNHPRATFNIGSFYHRGEVVDVDHSKALEYYQKSAELGYMEAHERLGKLYLQGHAVDVDYEKAQMHLTKAWEDEEDFDTGLSLGELHCMATGELRDIDLCLDYFLLEIDKSQTTKQKNRNRNTRKSTIARALIEGEYTQVEMEEIQAYLRKLYYFNHVGFEFQLNEQGVYTFKESERYGKRGEYELVSETGATLKDDGSKKQVKVLFDTDIEGIDTRQDQVVVLVKWTYTTLDGQEKPSYYTLLYGSPVGEQWSSYYALDADKPGIYTANFYDLNQSLVHSASFNIQ